MIVTSSAWPLLSDQYLNGVIFIVALTAIITIICYDFVAVIIIILQ